MPLLCFPCLFISPSVFLISLFPYFYPLSSQQNIILFSSTKVLNGVLQPPPTDEQRQRVRSMMEALQASARSPGQTSNILYPLTLCTQDTLDFTLLHLTVQKLTHASVSIWQGQREQQHMHALALRASRADHFHCRSDNFLDFCIPLKAHCTTQGRYCISLSAPKGSVHPSSWLTYSHTPSFFISPTHARSYFTAHNCSVGFTFLSAFNRKQGCHIRPLRRINKHINSYQNTLLCTVYTKHEFVWIYFTVFLGSLTFVFRRVGDVFLCLSDFTLKWGWCYQTCYPTIGLAFCQSLSVALILSVFVCLIGILMRAPERLNSCLTPLVIFTVMCEILQLHSD